MDQSTVSHQLYIDAVITYPTAWMQTAVASQFFAGVLTGNAPDEKNRFHKVHARHGRGGGIEPPSDAKNSFTGDVKLLLWGLHFGQCQSQTTD
jgi:hypothetical protein